MKGVIFGPSQTEAGRSTLSSQKHGAASACIQYFPSEFLSCRSVVNVLYCS